MCVSGVKDFLLGRERRGGTKLGSQVNKMAGPGHRNCYEPLAAGKDMKSLAGCVKFFTPQGDTVRIRVSVIGLGGLKRSSSKSGTIWNRKYEPGSPTAGSGLP